MIDVETTGLAPDVDRIVEIAVVTTDPWGRVLEEWSTRINPQRPVGATHIHGIADADVAGAAPFSDLIAQLNQRLAGAALAAHNAKFDIAFLRAEYLRAGWLMPNPPALCTLQASEYYLPTLDRRSLADCCWAVGTPLHGAHSALGDARATAVLLAAFMHPHIGHPPLSEHLGMPAAALKIPWPAAPTRARQPATQSPDTARSLQQQAGLSASPTGPATALVELVARFSLIDALDEGAPDGSLAYLEKLAEILEDGEVTAEEATDLTSVAHAHQLDAEAVTAANRSFVLALAQAAMEDGKITRAERTELQQICELLGCHQRIIPALLERAESARLARMSAGLAELPMDWPYGEPLRVGDKVAITGCNSANRPQLESRSEKLGVRIASGVSPKTAMLVSDGTINGGKAAKARDLGIRIEPPDTYLVLLEHLQPALPREVRALPKPRSTAPKPAATKSTEAPAQPPESVSVEPNPALVRAWARANGHEVGTRGRLHKDLIDAYVQANPNP